jgi:hypothetical protein
VYPTDVGTRTSGRVAGTQEHTVPAGGMMHGCYWAWSHVVIAGMTKSSFLYMWEHNGAPHS